MGRKNLIVSLVCLFFNYGLFSQPKVEFGEMSADDFKEVFYSKDKDAEALVLHDIGRLHFEENTEGGFDVVFERRTKIKIFNDAGLKWGEISIPLYRHDNIYETVQEIKGVTITVEENKFITYKLDPKNKYTEKINEYYDREKYAMPNVKAGSVIEYAYKIKTQYIFKLPDWEFQWRIPVQYSEYKLKMIPFYSYVFLLQGSKKFDFQDSYVEQGLKRQYGPVSYNDVVYIYTLKDVPAFRDEEFISSYDDYVIKLGFQLDKVTNVYGVEVKHITTWEELTKELTKNTNFGGYYKSAVKQGEKIIENMNLIQMTDQEKIDKIVDYVKSNFTWNGWKAYFTSKKVKEFMIQKEGNSADINLFLAGMLKAAGLEVSPVILSTRDHGKIKYDYPFVDFFNYVIPKINVDGNDIFTDGTSNLYSNFCIPLNCINERGLIISNDKPEWVNLNKQYIPSSVTNIFKLSTGQEMDSVLCEYIIQADGYKGVGLKHIYKNNDIEFIEHIEKEGYHITDSVKMRNYNDPEVPYIIESKVKIPWETIDGKYFLSPFLNEPPNENIFKQTKRTHPVDLVYAYKYIYHSVIMIPAGYKVTFIPKDINIDNKYCFLFYNSVIEGDSISISAQYGYKYPVYPADTYGTLKYLNNEVIRQFHDKLVFEKK